MDSKRQLNIGVIHSIFLPSMGNLFILISVALNVAGQAVLKSGVNKLGALSMSGDSFVKAFSSLEVWGGLFFYGISSLFWILALSHKDLSYAYPMLSLGYILVVLVSWFLLGEQITPMRILGVAFISFGVYLVFKTA